MLRTCTGMLEWGMLFPAVRVPCIGHFNAAIANTRLACLLFPTPTSRTWEYWGSALHWHPKFPQMIAAEALWLGRRVTRPTARPTDKLENGLVPETEVDPLKSFDLDVFHLVPFFSVVFRASRGGGRMGPEEGSWNGSGLFFGESDTTFRFTAPGPPEIGD